MSGKVILLLDEVHRLDKAKQDFLLPYLENGMITLIGATTSNPYHAINPAIRSRCQIFELKSLETNDITTALERALHDEERGLVRMKRMSALMPLPISRLLQTEMSAVPLTLLSSPSFPLNPMSPERFI